MYKTLINLSPEVDCINSDEPLSRQFGDPVHVFPREAARPLPPNHPLSPLRHELTDSRGGGTHGRYLRI